MARIHDLTGISAEFAYAETQCNSEIKDGDILILDDGIGVMVMAWPVVVVGECDGFHKFADGWEKEYPQHVETVTFIQNLEKKEKTMAIQCIYVANAFSLSMLNGMDSAEVRVDRLDNAQHAADLLHGAMVYGDCAIVSAVGHADTANLFSNLLGMEIQVRRESIIIDGISDDFLIVGQYSGPRLPEGAKTLPEGAEVIWYQVQIFRNNV